MSKADKKRERQAEIIKDDAKARWDAGYTHHVVSLEASDDPAYYLQWIENVGWKLTHAGFVWAEKGYVGYGGFGLLNSSVVGTFVFDR